MDTIDSLLECRVPVSDLCDIIINYAWEYDVVVNLSKERRYKLESVILPRNVSECDFEGTKSPCPNHFTERRTFMHSVCHSYRGEPAVCTFINRSCGSHRFKRWFTCGLRGLGDSSPGARDNWFHYWYNARNLLVKVALHTTDETLSMNHDAYVWHIDEKRRVAFAPGMRTMDHGYSILSELLNAISEEANLPYYTVYTFRCCYGSIKVVDDTEHPNYVGPRAQGAGTHVHSMDHDPVG